MKINTSRFKPAFKAMSVHFGLSLLVAAVVALLVFTFWFPYPYRELAGVRELFILVMAVDIVCGPLLTFVLFSPTKSKMEVLKDISLIVVIQLIALCYGIWNVWQIRPLYLVQEADRFNVITAANIDYKNLGLLPANLKIKLLGGPIMVSLRDIELNSQETTNDSIEFESKYRSGRPNLYVKYNGTRAYKNAYPIRNLIITQPDKKELVENLAFASDEINTNQLRYMYILGHHTWIVILKTTGEPIGYMNSK